MDGDEEALPCPACQAVAVVFDYLQGLSVCESCGRVLHDDELVPQIFTGEESRPSGVFVPARDSGLGASAQLLSCSAAGRTIQRSRPKEPVLRMRQALKDLSSKLALAPGVQEQADLFVEQLTPLLAGAWRREHVAAAAAYVAIRLNQVPLTLLDLGSALQVDIFTLGRCYRAALLLLNVHPPQMQAVDLLDRAVDRVMPGNAAAAAVRQDAALVLAWMERHLVGRQHPLVALGAAIVVACEMNNVAVGLHHVSSTLRVGIDTLSSKLQQVRLKLLSFSSLLPYAGHLTAKNVASHARTIFRLSTVLEASPAAAAAAAAATEAPTPPAAEQQVAEPMPQAEGRRRSRKRRGSTAAGDGPGDIPGEIDPRGPKRVRFSGDGGGSDSGARGAAAGRLEGQQQQQRQQQQAAEGGREGRSGGNGGSGSAAAAADGGNEGGAGLGSEDDLSDAELEGYLRSAEEVELFKELYEARGDG